MNKELQMARPLAPEDVLAGQYVCITSVVSEHFPFWCLLEESWKTPRPVRMVMMPDEAGRPLRVVEVCVPFVLVEQVDGSYCTLDLRRHRVAEVSERFGQRAFKRLRARAAVKAE